MLELVAELNADDAVDGILVQLPLPDAHRRDEAIEALDPGKDVDGFHPVNAGRLYSAGRASCPARRSGSCACSTSTAIEPRAHAPSSSAASSIVGKPMAHLLLQANATVTICHSRTVDLERHTLEADILVAAVGQQHVITAEMVKPGATVIDVGMNRTEDGLFGDVDPSVAERAA